MVAFLFLVTALAGFVLLFAAIFSFLFRKELAMNARIESYFGTDNNKKEKQQKTEQASWWYPVYYRYKTKGLEIVSKRIEKKARLKLELLLRDAGYHHLSATEVRLFQLVTSIGTGTVTVLLMAPSMGGQAWLSAAAVAMIVFRYPMLYFSKKKAKRAKMIDREMADFFDMVNLLLEAGVGLDSALNHVCRKKSGPLSEEFLLVLDEMKRGKSRREALYNLKKRVASENLKSVLGSIIQADQLGIGMAKVIRNLTVSIRERRREAAREQAMKAPVKMLIPMVMFIFPSLFIIILGPMAITLVTGGLGF